MQTYMFIRYWSLNHFAMLWWHHYLSFKFHPPHCLPWLKGHNLPKIHHHASLPPSQLFFVYGCFYLTRYKFTIELYGMPSFLPKLTSTSHEILLLVMKFFSNVTSRSSKHLPNTSTIAKPRHYCPKFLRNVISKCQCLLLSLPSTTTKTQPS